MYLNPYEKEEFYFGKNHGKPLCIRRRIYLYVTQTYAQLQAIAHSFIHFHFLCMNIQKSISTQLHIHYIIITIQ